MPFAAPPPDFHPVRSEVTVFSRYQGVPYRGGLTHPFGVTTRTITAIHFGQTTYRF